MLLLLALAQITPVQPLPRGTGLPPATAESAAEPQAVLAVVNRLLAALQTSDRAAILAVTRPDGGATAAMERPDGTRQVRRIGWAAFAAGLEPGGGWSEAISDPAVEVDGDIAMVWAPYVVRRNGVAHHCGFDHFDLVREAGQWKILNVTWSQRTTGCAAS